MERISKAIIYFLVFLLPLFFLPWGAEILDLPKQALLYFLLLLALIFWLFKSTFEVKIITTKTIFNWLFLFFFLVLAVSTFFLYINTAVFGVGRYLLPAPF